MTSVASADISKIAEALRETARQSELTTRDVLIAAANQILAEMEVRAPVDSGNLRANLGIRIHPDRVEIGPDPVQVPYAAYVELGTQPHDIKPKNPNGVLVFTVGGQKVFAKIVHHPGTKPQPFMRDSFMAWVDSLGTMAAEANIQVLKKEAS